MRRITGQDHSSHPKSVHHARIHAVEGNPSQIPQHNVVPAGAIDDQFLNRVQCQRGNILGSHVRDKLIVLTAR